MFAMYQVTKQQKRKKEKPQTMGTIDMLYGVTVKASTTETT